MAWELKSIIAFAVASIIFGSSYACVAQGIKYFTPCLFQTFRMLFGFISMLILCGTLMLLNKSYAKEAKLNMELGFKIFLYVCLGGLFNLGLPHCLTAIAQETVPSSIVQIMQPLIPISGSIFSHFLLSDERFTIMKFYSFIFGVIGVGLSATPSFTHFDKEANSKKMIIGYILTVVSMISFGFAPVFLKLKTSCVETGISVSIQLIASTIFECIFGLFKDGPYLFVNQITKIEGYCWMWPIIVGILASGIAMYAMMYLVNSVGAFGANLVPFGQMIVGLLIGVVFLKEWANYKLWEILISIAGCIFLCVSLGISLFDGRTDNDSQKESNTNDEESNESEIRL